MIFNRRPIVYNHSGMSCVHGKPPWVKEDILRARPLHKEEIPPQHAHHKCALRVLHMPTSCAKQRPATGLLLSWCSWLGGHTCGPLPVWWGCAGRMSRGTCACEFSVSIPDRPSPSPGLPLLSVPELLHLQNSPSPSMQEVCASERWCVQGSCR